MSCGSKVPMIDFDRQFCPHIHPPGLPLLSLLFPSFFFSPCPDELQFVASLESNPFVRTKSKGGTLKTNPGNSPLLPFFPPSFSPSPSERSLPSLTPFTGKTGLAFSEGFRSSKTMKPCSVEKCVQFFSSSLLFPPPPPSHIDETIRTT